MAETLIGTKMPGFIRGWNRQPYDLILETGEVIKLAHSYEDYAEVVGFPKLEVA
jgi:hypothetical protein